MNSEQVPVIIVGAGWSGLAAAIELSTRNIPVIVLESAKQTGGRARRVPFDGKPVDNGQHILIGAYQQTLQLLKTISADIEQSLHRQPLYLDVRGSEKRGLRLKSISLPAPVNLFLALLTMKGITLFDRFRAIYFSTKLYFHRFQFQDDIDVESFLIQQYQSPELIRKLWQPLCLATLNTPLQQASAEVFTRVLYDAFCQHRDDSDLLLPRCDLSSLFPDLAADFIEQHGGSVRLGQRVIDIQVENGRVTGVTTEDTQFTAQHVILATPPYSTHKILVRQANLQELLQSLSSFEYEPICTVYLQYPSSLELESPMLGLLDGIGQWVFDRRICQQPGLLAIVISADGPHMQMDNSALAQTVSQELASLFTDWPAPLETMVIREKRATFKCRVAINSIRPDNLTAIHGLLLAGDYTRTAYPATLEGAIRSGQRCANLIEYAQGT